MTVPEASMNKNHLSPSNESQVGCAWNIAAMDSVAKAQRRDQPPYEQLWLGIGPTYGAHDGGTVHKPTDDVLAYLKLS